MALTTPRWLAIFVGAALLVSAALFGTDWTESLARPPAFAEPRGQAPAEIARYELGAWRAARMADRLRVLRIRDSILTAETVAEARRTGRSVLFDASFDDESRAAVALAVAEAVSSPPADSRVPTIFAFVSDTASVVEAVARPRWRLHRDFLLPNGPDQPCVVLTRVASGSTALGPDRLRDWTVGRLRGTLAGPCAFFAAFGLPGSGVRAWLASGGLDFATSTLPATPGRSDTDPTAFANVRHSSNPLLSTFVHGESYHEFLLRERMEAPAGIACLGGTPTACERELTRARSGTARLESWGDLIVRESHGSMRMPLGLLEPQLLSGLVRTVGPDAFGQFWRSQDDLPSAFEGAAGIGIGSAVAEWSEQNYGRLHLGPGLHARGIAWGALLVGAMLIASTQVARRRSVS